MKSLTGVAAATAVLAGGLALAMFFYQPEPPQSQAARTDAVRHRAEDGPRFLMEVRSAPPPVSNIADQPPPPQASPQPPAAIAALPLFEADATSVPRIARNYPVTADRPVPPAAETSHRVADGDTLDLLARRYLGDAARAAEIFERNRDVLASPDLLPIGAVLKIPAR